MISAFMKHVNHCNIPVITSDHPALYAGPYKVGYVDSRLQDYFDFLKLRQTDGTFVVKTPSVLQQLAKNCAQEGFYKPHNEEFDVVIAPGCPSLCKVDRGIIPLLGLLGMGVHLNGLVKRNQETYLWVATRSTKKRLDPGKLDHLAAGGINAGLTPFLALKKEAAEEASVPASLIMKAQSVGLLRYCLLRPEGLRRDALFCYDLWLPEDFIPTPTDGEVDHFKLIHIKEVLELVKHTTCFKFNVNLVLIDLFMRLGLVNFHPQDTVALVQSLHQGLYPDADEPKIRNFKSIAEK